jgi:hypothetical protein
VRSFPDPFPNRFESELYQRNSYNTGASLTKNHFSADNTAGQSTSHYNTEAKGPVVIDHSKNALDSIWKILTNQSNLREQQLKSAYDASIANHNDPEVLKPGNYLFVTWDGVWWKETESKVSHLCQIAASVTNGESFMAHILPGLVN